jgi:hypothetical protein
MYFHFDFRLVRIHAGMELAGQMTVVMPTINVTVIQGGKVQIVTLLVSI